MKTLTSLFLLLLLCASCATARIDSKKQLSSGYVGCSPDQVKIENEQRNSLSNTDSWAATCKDKKYYCSASAGAMSCKAAE